MRAVQLEQASFRGVQLVEENYNEEEGNTYPVTTNTWHQHAVREFRDVDSSEGCQKQQVAYLQRLAGESTRKPPNEQLHWRICNKLFHLYMISYGGFSLDRQSCNAMAMALANAT